MTPVAGRGLHDLGLESFGVAEQQLPKNRVRIDFVEESFRSHPQGFARQLDKGFDEGGVDAGEKGDA